MIDDGKKFNNIDTSSRWIPGAKFAHRVSSGFHAPVQMTVFPPEQFLTRMICRPPPRLATCVTLFLVVVKMQKFLLIFFVFSKKTKLYFYHRHLSNIDCLTAHTACLVCFISTFNGRSKKKKSIKTGTSSGQITNLKQSILETFDIYDLYSNASTVLVYMIVPNRLEV